MKEARRNERAGPARRQVGGPLPQGRASGSRTSTAPGAATARATILGNFLSQNQGREVPIQVGDRSGRARLCVDAGEATSPAATTSRSAGTTPLSPIRRTARPAEGPAALDDGLGPAVAKEPDVAPPIPPAIAPASGVGVAGPDGAQPRGPGTRQQRGLVLSGIGRVPAVTSDHR